MARTSSKAKTSWNLRNYDTVTFRIKKGEKDLLRHTAEEAGISISRLIVDALNESHPGLLTVLDDTSKHKK